MRQLKIQQSITTRSEKSVDIYLAQLSKYRLINAETEKELFVALRALQEEATEYKLSPLALKRRVEILTELKQLYRGYLKPDIVSVAIVQPPGMCFLEITRRIDDLRESEIVEREDLRIFGENDGDMFPSDAPVHENANKFINQLNAYDFIMTGMPLFTNNAISEISFLWKY